MSEVKVTQLCLTVCNPMDYKVHGILQARILEWVAFPFPRGSSQSRDQSQVSHIAGGCFTSWATGKPQNTGVGILSILQRIFLTQESNRGLLPCKRIFYQLIYQGSSWVECLKLGVSVLSQNTQFRLVAGIERTRWIAQRLAGFQGWRNSAAWLRCCLWFRFFPSLSSACCGVSFPMNVASLWGQDYCSHSRFGIHLSSCSEGEKFCFEKCSWIGARPCLKASSRSPS